MRLYFISFIILFLDQITKFLIQFFMKEGESITLIKNYIKITYVNNSGAAFGILQDKIYFLTIISIVVGIFLIYYILKIENKNNEKFALFLILSGTVGNLIDRIYFKQVCDFIDIGLYSVRWPAFNIADAVICLGILFLIKFSFFEQT